MMLLLRRQQPLIDQQFHGVGRLIQQKWQFLLLGRCKIPQHKVRGIHTSGRPAHPYSHA